MIYKQSDWDNRYVKADSSWFANCCGATYVHKVSEKTKFNAPHKGIRVFSGIHGKEYEGTKQFLKHIKTRNGDITVNIRHVY